MPCKMEKESRKSKRVFRRKDKTKYPDNKHQQASIQLAFAYVFLLTVYRRQAQKLKKIDLNANICRFKRQKKEPKL